MSVCPNRIINVGASVACGRNLRIDRVELLVDRVAAFGSNARRIQKDAALAPFVVQTPVTETPPHKKGPTPRYTVHPAHSRPEGASGRTGHIPMNLPPDGSKWCTDLNVSVSPTINGGSHSCSSSRDGFGGNWRAAAANVFGRETQRFICVSSP